MNNRLFIRVPCLIILIIIVLAVPSVRAGEEGIKPVTIGHGFTLISEVLGEERGILVYLPPGYDRSTATYPVIYLLDGDNHFHHATGIVDFLARNRRIPPAVVVGIGIGYHEWVISVRALMLLIINIACINISGTLTFRLKGVRGATWWREKKAKEGTRLMLAGWIITLVLLVGMLVLDGVLTKRYPETFGRFRISKKAGILGIY